jgi:biopolymer transport protein ExbB
VLEIIKAGGWLMAPIILCSILSLTIIAERFWTLRRSKVVPDDLGGKVEEWAARHELDRRHIETLRSGSVLGRVLAAGLVNRHRSRHLIKESIEDTGRHVVHELERFLNTLGTIAGISPLLGLLGTVIGMIKVFSDIMTFGVGDANQMAGGISEALITTAAGLTVAIPSFFFYRYFKGRVEAYVVSMEEQAINLIEAIERGNVAQLGSGVPGG